MGIPIAIGMRAVLMLASLLFLLISCAEKCIVVSFLFFHRRGGQRPWFGSLQRREADRDGQPYLWAETSTASIEG